MDACAIARSLAPRLGFCISPIRPTHLGVIRSHHYVAPLSLSWPSFLSHTSLTLRTATHPLDLIKVRIQVARGAAGSAEAAAEGIFKTGAKVFSTEGVPGLYKGCVGQNDEQEE